MNDVLEEIRALRRRQEKTRNHYLRSSLVLAVGWSAVLLPTVSLLIPDERLDPALPEWYYLLVRITIGSMALSLLFAALVQAARINWNDGADGKFLSKNLLMAQKQRTDASNLLIKRHLDALERNEKPISKMRRSYTFEIGIVAVGVATFYYAIAYRLVETI